MLLITGEDEQELSDELAAAGRKVVYTVAVAVYAAMSELREQHGGLAKATTRGTSTRRHLLAGCEGSWEFEGLISLALWAGRGKPSRVHEPSRQAITDMIVQWVTDPGRFTEVAETLAVVVSGYADEHGGWRAVADQWLQPGALDREGMHVTYSLLYSLGKDFDPAVLG